MSRLDTGSIETAGRIPPLPGTSELSGATVRGALSEPFAQLLDVQRCVTRRECRSRIVGGMVSTARPFATRSIRLPISPSNGRRNAGLVRERSHVDVKSRIATHIDLHGPAVRIQTRPSEWKP